MAWSDRERYLRFLLYSCSGCWFGRLQYMNLSEICTLIFTWKESSPANVVFTGIGVLLSVRILGGFMWIIVTRRSLRQLRMLAQAKIPFWTLLSALKCSFDDLRSI